MPVKGNEDYLFVSLNLECLLSEVYCASCAAVSMPDFIECNSSRVS